VKKHSRRFERIKPQTLETLHPAVQAILSEFMFDLKGLEDELNEVAQFQDGQQRAAENVRRQAIREVEEHRQSLIKEFSSQISDLQDDIIKLVQYWNTRISFASSELRRQAAAIGISM
jgi:hypothetical protein